VQSVVVTTKRFAAAHVPASTVQVPAGVPILADRTAGRNGATPERSVASVLAMQQRGGAIA
jgi:hypothetical protein